MWKGGVTSRIAFLALICISLEALVLLACQRLASFEAN